MLTAVVENRSPQGSQWVTKLMFFMQTYFTQKTTKLFRFSRISIKNLYSSSFYSIHKTVIENIDRVPRKTNKKSLFSLSPPKKTVYHNDKTPRQTWKPYLQWSTWHLLANIWIFLSLYCVVLYLFTLQLTQFPIESIFVVHKNVNLS